MGEPQTTTVRTVTSDESFKSAEYTVKVLREVGVVLRAKDGSHQSFIPIHNIIKITQFPASEEEE
ncbi:MAG: hypothetical protein E4H02_10430 [Lentisphaerales bacterium]|nr:MAG: hypothetical protein E4H02_10430 [Lentisphaerales bacterium]